VNLAIDHAYRPIGALAEPRLREACRWSTIGRLPERTALAQHKSAKKRARQSLQRRNRNRQIRSRLKTAVKYARVALAGGEPEAKRDALRSAEGEIRKAASKGVLTKKQASRRVSRLARRLNATS
jgi:small subunit ribosomal protein S20